MYVSAQFMCSPMCFTQHASTLGEVAFCPKAVFVQQDVFLRTCLMQQHSAEITNEGEKRIEKKTDETQEHVRKHRTVREATKMFPFLSRLSQSKGVVFTRLYVITNVPIKKKVGKGISICEYSH